MKATTERQATGIALAGGGN
jgi:hypothetical protein